LLHVATILLPKSNPALHTQRGVSECLGKHTFLSRVSHFVAEDNVLKYIRWAPTHTET